MKEKNKAVIANIAIRALCCFRALSIGYCFPENRAGPKNGVIKRKQKQRNKYVPGICAPFGGSTENEIVS